jgi:hypothetical protein
MFSVKHNLYFREKTQTTFFILIFLLYPTNAQLSHKSIYHNYLLCNLRSYMFRHFRVIIRYLQPMSC